MRYLVLVAEGTEALDVGVEDAQTVHIALFGMAAHELLADADAQHRLRERAYDAVQPVLPQIVHRARSLALTREDYPVGAAKFFGRVRQDWLDAHSLQGVNDGKDVSRIVFHHSYLHAVQFFSECFQLSEVKEEVKKGSKLASLVEVICYA